MIQLGVLRIANGDALPFAREKLRACLVAGGLRHVVASQVTAAVSQSVRARLPAEVSVSLEENGQHLLIRSPDLAGRYERIRLPTVAEESEVEIMRAVLARLTREELLHDLERQVEERTAALEQERERSESLLRNMLPEVIAHRMKLGETIADTLEATVLFADIVGFTSLASIRGPEEVVSMLDRIFTRFDEIAATHSLEKIKTIGDSYMAAAGLPVPQVDHIDRAVLMGLDMVAAIPELRDQLGVEIDVRIGVHTGPVVAGVIGTQKFAYDIWGDTVNVASRMESHGVPGRVQISDDVRIALGRRFQLEERGSIPVKNRGEIRTWFVTGIKALQST